MGGGIVQVCAQAGYSIVIRDFTEKLVEKGLKAIKWSVGKLVDKGKVQGTVNEILGRIHGTKDLADAKDSDFVFEAIIEDLEAKRILFSELDTICAPHTIFASNTSAIPITNISEATQRTSQFVGTHFFSPVSMMKIVEIVRGLLTSEQTIEISENLCPFPGRETIRVNRDIAGFALNRINIPSTIEAIKLVEAGITSVEDIDKGMRLGFGRSMGPFETSDLAGLDVSFNACSTIYKETQDEKFHPPMLLQKNKNWIFSRKTKIGWYQYDDGKKIGVAD